MGLTRIRFGGSTDVINVGRKTGFPAIGIASAD
jgi:hypothetical protein